MKKLLILILCLSFLASCVPVPAYAPKEPAASETAAAASANAGKTAEPRPTAAPTLTPTPVPTPTPTPTPVPTPTAPPDQTYTGTYFRFNVPSSWLKADVPDGAYFYPNHNDIQHTYLMYQEGPNDMSLTETKLDIALMFSSRDTITAMVEGALTDSGMTDFALSPVDIEKIKLNDITCYKGASDITLGGETYDFVGHIFLKKDKMIMLIWVGDQARYAAGLKTVYDSFQAVQ